MNLPDIIRIGAIDYTVKSVKDLHTHNGDERHWLNGHILHSTAEIKVESELSPDMQVTVLWHEVLHGILTQAAVEEQPENLIVILGYGLVRLIRDNPVLMKLTIEGECDDGGLKS
jgi:hypothetical protein